MRMVKYQSPGQWAGSSLLSAGRSYGDDILNGEANPAKQPHARLPTLQSRGMRCRNKRFRRGKYVSIARISSTCRERMESQEKDVTDA